MALALGRKMAVIRKQVFFLQRGSWAYKMESTREKATLLHQLDVFRGSQAAMLLLSLAPTPNHPQPRTLSRTKGITNLLQVPAFRLELIAEGASSSPGTL